MYASSRPEFYHRFYSELIRRYWHIHPDRRIPKAPRKNWLDYGAGKTGVKFGWSFHRGDRFSAEIYIDTGERETNLVYFEKLRNVVGLTAGLKQRLAWEELPKKRASRIALYYPAEVDVLMQDPLMVEELHTWGVANMRILEETFAEEILLL
jgi:hypothetical protein